MKSRAALVVGSSLALLLFAGVVLPVTDASEIPKADAVIVNHSTWLDTRSKPIQAHDGGITRVGETFYWYGTSYAGNPRGLYGSAQPRLWNGVLVYSSPNLVDWTYRGKAVVPPRRGWGTLGTSGRPHVLYNDKTRQYVMWYCFHMQYPAVMMMVAVSDTPVGPFTVLGPREVGADTGFASDHNVFKDDDGKAYLVYTDHEPLATAVPGSNGRYAIRIDSLTDDYLSSNQEGVYALSEGCEAPAMIKYKGKYLVAASGVAGWGAPRISTRLLIRLWDHTAPRDN
ncbi:MAG: family 43 glycosylhydrolase [Acidobacteriota bacterium]